VEQHTEADEIIQSFESNFADKNELPSTLELMWLKKAVARYSTEIEEVEYDEEEEVFTSKLSQYAIDTMANYMWQLYQEREVSKVNKRVSIIGKDLSWNSAGNLNKYNVEELAYIANKSSEMTEHQKPPAYN
jgi:hypothetical protein